MSVYLHLFHGRKDRSTELDAWGEDGPTLGPLRYVHTTYSSLIHLGLPKEDNRESVDLDIRGDLVFYRGMFYGDWSVFGERELREDKITAEPVHADPNSYPTGYECSVDDGLTWMDHNKAGCTCHNFQDTVVLIRKNEV